MRASKKRSSKVLHETRSSRRKRKERACIAIVSYVVVIVAAVGICGFKIGSILIDYNKADNLYDDIKKEYLVVEEADIDISTITDNIELEPLPEWGRNVDVDVAKIKASYPEVAGWIHFEDGEISYPIMYSGDNEKYMRTAYNGERSVGGSIFLDGSDTKDMDDSHMVIYGHNMKDKSMFGKLRYYNNSKDYYDDHKYFQIISEAGKDRYQIFSYSTVSAYSDIFDTLPKGDSGLLAFVENQILRGTNPLDNLTIDNDDQIVSLVTCSATGYRLVVSAVKIDHIDQDVLGAYREH